MSAAAIASVRRRVINFEQSESRKRCSIPHEVTRNELADPDQQPNPLVLAGMALLTGLNRLAADWLDGERTAAALELLCAADCVEQALGHVITAKNRLASD